MRDAPCAQTIHISIGQWSIQFCFLMIQYLWTEASIFIFVDKSAFLVTNNRPQEKAKRQGMLPNMYLFF